MQAGPGTARLEQADALSAGTPHARVHHAGRAALVQRAAERARRGVAAGVEHGGRYFAAAQVVQARIDRHLVQPHRQMHRAFTRGRQKSRVVIGRLRHRGGTVARGVEHAVGAVREAAARRVDMREGGHDRPAAGAEHAVLGGNELHRTGLVAQAVVGQGLERVQRLEVRRVGHAVVQVHAGVARGHDAAGLRPLHALDEDRLGEFRNRLQDQPPPRAASSQRRTRSRSPTLPASICASALEPPKAAFGFLTQASAAAVSGSRICSAL